MQDEVLTHLDLSEQRLTAARELLHLHLWRDAANRAYYSMFHTAMALVRSRGGSPKTHRGLDHEVRSLALVEDGISEEDWRAFRQAQTMRDIADYALIDELNDEIVEVTVERAEHFLEKVRSLLDGN